ncbi:hypothetical protein ABZW11_00825 [Nonomuraea sp. NPDC004580]|uniref:hypothetical protein n=1 Tax=Nonomuraea sp. NPDC004580 TaxID=3154552 RepID=UPI0033B2F9FD
MADQWEPIRIYSYLGESRPDLSVTRERVVSYLNGADPDSVERAGRSYVEAAKLIKGEGGVQGALMKAAKDLSEVWSGDGAKQALKALRLLHASAGALGEAMQKTGEPMQKYAERVRHYRSTVPAPAGNPEQNSGGGMTNGGPSGGSGGGTGGGTGETAPPVIQGGGDGGGSGGMGYAPLDADADERARKHLESLNNEIADINARIADGLAFELPTINPLTVDTQPANKLNAPTVTDLSNGNGDGRWNGGTSDPDVTAGAGDRTGSGSTGTGSGGTGDGTNGSNGDGTGKGDGNGDQGDGTTQPQDPGGQGQDDPSTGDDPTTQQPGTETPQQDQPGGQDQQQDVPPVITAEDSGTDLAQTTTQPPATTTTPNPYATTPNPYTSTPPGILPTTQPPGGTPFTGGGPTAGGPWYGTGGPAATSPAVLRGGGAPGNGFMAFPAGAMGAGAQDHCDEHTREYYDSEPDIWSPPVPTSPEKLC